MTFPGAIEVDRCVPLTYSAMRVTTAYVAAIYTLINLAMEQGKWTGKTNPVMLEDGSVGTQIVISYADGRLPKTAQPGDWIVVDSELNVETFPPSAHTDKYHGSCPITWAAASTPPAVTVNEDGTLEVAFRQPTSMGGPWSYTVEVTDITDDNTAVRTPTNTAVESVISMSGLIVGAEVKVTVTGGLTTGHGYTFAVVAVDAFGNEARSARTDTLSL